MQNNTTKITKAKYWTAVCYPENMREDWQDVIGDVLGLPYAYCIHNKDVLGKYNPTDNEEYQRKVHVHIMIVFNNTTTYNHVMDIFNGLSAPGKKALNTCEKVNSVRNTYEYLIHNTESSIKQGKYQYDTSERITGNNFDIGSYEQLSASDKKEIIRELCNFIRENNITNFADFYSGVMEKYSEEYFDLIISHSGLFERLCRGNFHKIKFPHSGE